jgi:hypothetical protein
MSHIHIHWLQSMQSHHSHLEWLTLKNQHRHNHHDSIPFHPRDISTPHVLHRAQAELDVLGSGGYELGIGLLLKGQSHHEYKTLHTNCITYQEQKFSSFLNKNLFQRWANYRSWGSVRKTARWVRVRHLERIDTWGIYQTQNILHKSGVTTMWGVLWRRMLTFMLIQSDEYIYAYLLQYLLETERVPLSKSSFMLSGLNA